MGQTNRRPFKPRDTQRARALRREATPAERTLWQYLSKRQLQGFKFSRQIPVGPYICDFICRAEKLVVELDGFSHEHSEQADQQRTDYIVAAGYRVMRFVNEDVFQNIEGVLTSIAETLTGGDKPTPNPSRLREGN